VGTASVLILIIAQRAQEFGYHPEIILAGRRLNDSMGECSFPSGEANDKISVNGANLLMLGITFRKIVLMLEILR
jgi:UDP-N-acetyl-D-galactosamine dehydrogenase